VYVQFSNLLLCWTYDHDFYGTRTCSVARTLEIVARNGRSSPCARSSSGTDALTKWCARPALPVTH